MMKTRILLLSLTMFSLLDSCSKLDLNPLSGPSTETFYSNQTELELAINDLYQISFWGNDNEQYSDNFWHRGLLGNSITFGTMNSEDPMVSQYWFSCYQAIERVNSFLANKDRASSSTTPEVINRLEAEARCIRAYEYGRLIDHFGDVPLITRPLSLEESDTVTKTDKNVILNFILSELDFAASNLPMNYASSDLKKLTSGAALSIKAREALYNEKWSIARDAAEQVIHSNVYSLENNYSDLFLKSGGTSKELIISIPRDLSLGVATSETVTRDFLPRNAGGYGAEIPTRSMMDAYECTDGKPINESSLYDPHFPFRNRDPRLLMSIVEFGSDWLGYDYQPHPDSITVFSSKLGTRVTNNDTRSVAPFASYTGLLWKKGVEQSWADNRTEDADVYIIRYAEILLTYAEAKIELGEIDQSVLDAINTVRARGYGTNLNEIDRYPSITSTDPTELREIVRRERRVEFPLEGLRYMDLIRWRLAEKALTRPVIGLPDPAVQDRKKWPFPGVTPLDKDGIPDYSVFGNDVKIVAERDFNKSRQYLWPIPAIELRVNSNLTQNVGY